MSLKEDLKIKNDKVYNNMIDNLKDNNLVNNVELIKKAEKSIKHLKKYANNTKKLNELKSKKSLSVFAGVESNTGSMGNIDNTILSNTEKSNQHSI